MKKNPIFLLFLVFIVSFFIIFFAYPPIRFYIPFYQNVRIYAIAIFRNPLCSATNALKGLSHVQQINDLTANFNSRMRVVTKDPEGFELWETPKGPFLDSAEIW